MSSARSRLRDVAARRRGILLCAALLAATVPVGAETSTVGWDPEIEERWQTRPPSLGIENAFRDTLVSWARGSESAVRRYAAFQVEVGEGVAGGKITPRNLRLEDVSRSLECLRLIEGNTVRILAELAPETLAAVYAFELEVYLEQLRHSPRAWLFDLDWERLEKLERAYRSRREAPPKGEDRVLSRLLIQTAARLEEVGLVDQTELARQAFERALEHDADSVAARYSAAFLAEKLGLLRLAARHLEWLEAKRPLDFEVRLRRALVRGRLGERDEMAAELLHLPASAAAEWIRVLAWQELARHRAGVDASAALATLEEALAALPGRRGLEIQLAFYLGPASAKGRRLLANLLTAPPDPLPWPRALYAKGRDDELARVTEQLAEDLRARRELLVETMAVVEEQELLALAGERDPQRRDRKVFFECRGFKIREPRL